jgi:hypothetical protein
MCSGKFNLIIQMRLGRFELNWSEYNYFVLETQTHTHTHTHAHTHARTHTSPSPLPPKPHRTISLFLAAHKSHHGFSRSLSTNMLWRAHTCKLCDNVKPPVRHATPSDCASRQLTVDLLVVYKHATALKTFLMMLSIGGKV